MSQGPISRNIDMLGMAMSMENGDELHDPETGRTFVVSHGEPNESGFRGVAIYDKEKIGGLGEYIAKQLAECQPQYNSPITEEDKKLLERYGLKPQTD